VISDYGNASQTEENLKAIEAGPLEDEEIARVRRIVKQI
jgi:hypothetical protein